MARQRRHPERCWGFSPTFRAGPAPRPSGLVGAEAVVEVPGAHAANLTHPGPVNDAVPWFLARSTPSPEPCPHGAEPGDPTSRSRVAMGLGMPLSGCVTFRPQEGWG